MKDTDSELHETSKHQERIPKELAKQWKSDLWQFLATTVDAKSLWHNTFKALRELILNLRFY